MTHVVCRLTAKNWDRLRNPTLGNQVWATFTLCVRVRVRVCACVWSGRVRCRSTRCSVVSRSMKSGTAYINSASAMPSWRTPGAPVDLSQYQFPLSVSGSDCTKLVSRMGDSVAEWLACWTQAQKARVQIQSQRCRVAVLGKLFTPIVSLFTKQQNW